MNAKTALVMLSAMGIAALSGCSGSKPESVAEVRATLHRAKSCPDLLALLQADARAKVNEYFDRQIQYLQRAQQLGYQNAPSAGVEMAGAPSSAGEAKNASPAPQDSSRASSFSETNVQVKGVDEADIVKTDGKSIFLLHGTSFMVLNAWPADQLATASSIPIEGQPTEMYVDNGRVVIYSQVDGRPIYDAAGVKYRNEYSDYWYGGYDGGVRPAPADVAPGSYPAYIPQPLTKITVLTLQGTTPSVARELYFEGHYLSSRRVGNHVRTVLQGGAHGPTIKTYFDYRSGQAAPTTPEGWIAAYEALRRENLAAISATTVNDWLPYQFSKNGGSVQASNVACEDYYVPTAGTTQYGITQVQSIDLGNLGAMPKGTAIVGNVDTVYANTSTMYLASRSWSQEPLIEPMPMAGGGDAVASGGTAPPGEATVDPAPAPGTGTRTVRWWDRRTPVTLNFTHVHKLEFASDPTFPNYVASGTVPGQINDQFSMDEKDGVLRITTTENRLMVDARNASNNWGQRGTYNHVYALGQDGDWLKKIGDAGDMAIGERIFSTRFVGNRAYVVTFRQIDPLHVVDLSNPRELRVLGELTIPGFSTYMHPIDESTLLTIGRDSGRLQLQIFDVSDPMRPQQKHKFVYDGAATYGYSEAEQNHKAFTYFDDRKLLAFPFYGYNSTGMRSTLEVFKVDVNAGFTRVGAVDHSDFMQTHKQGYCGSYYSPMVRRGIFMENFVYSISYGGVKANDVGNLTGAGNQVALPMPGVPSYYNGGVPVAECAE